MNVHLKSILSALAFSFLFYSKSFGLNLFLISILVVVLITTLKKNRPISWLHASVYISTAIFVFLNPTGFTIFVHLMAFLAFVGKSISQKSSLHVAWLIGLINMIIASIVNYNEGRKTKIEKKDISPKLLNRLKGGLAAFCLLLVFALLYRNANPVFENIIEQIDLSFISVPWLFFTLLGYVLFLHLLRPLYPKELIDFDHGQGTELEKPTELVLIGSKKRLEGEQTLGSTVFLALNLLLIFFLATDIIYLFQENNITNASYSQSVHEGVYALMFSIICAIGLILYFFRGDLNFFEGNKRIKVLTYIWIALNLVLVAFTCYKNYTYVEALGLTYKRIGVFVYLLLILTGLVTAYIKVSQIKNFWYLVRTNIAVVFFFLGLSAVVPWDQAITKFNLYNISNPDLGYLIDLGESNSELLYEYAKTNKDETPLDFKRPIGEKYQAFLETQSEKTWQEYSLYNLTNTDLK